ncbi:MAG: hypothetical protein JWP91_2168 [Fibrobacteres bacterium]|nr:hypothetical protein [Fibrobacterota bacterium]
MVGLAVAWLSAAAWADKPIDDLETAGAPAPWAFYAGSEFPGATGSLSVIAGEGSGKAARLQGDFAKGGTYVAAQLTLPAPMTAAILSFRARSVPGTRILVRVTDNSDQTLQYAINRPLTATDPAAWFTRTVDLGDPTDAFGGAGDKILHQPLKRIAFLIEAMAWFANGERLSPAARLDFDDVSFLENPREELDPDAAPPPFAGTPRLDNLGVNIHFTRNDKALDALEGAGMAFLRMDLGWAGIEKAKGIYDFSAFDGLVASASARGLQVHFILDYSNPLYAPGPPLEAAAVAGFKAFASAAAAHFKGKVPSYEVWNEPNISVFWNPPDPAAYAALCKEAIAAVHAADPGAKVSTGGVSEVDWPFVRKAMGAGGAAGADAIGVHPYRGSHPETLIDQVVLLRESVRQAFPAGSPPLWDTEWGYTSSDFGPGTSVPARALHARYTVRRILTSWAAGFPFIVNYDLLDDGPDPLEREHNFGLLTTALEDKPAMTAVRVLAARTRGFAAKGFLGTRQSRLHALKLESATGTEVILWMEKQEEWRAKAAVDSIPVLFARKPMQAWDHLGRPLALPPQASGSYAFKAAYEPVYITFPKPGLAARSGRSAHVEAGSLLSTGRGSAESNGWKVWTETPGAGPRDFSGRRPERHSAKEPGIVPEPGSGPAGR